MRGRPVRGIVRAASGAAIVLSSLAWLAAPTAGAAAKPVAHSTAWRASELKPLPAPADPGQVMGPVSCASAGNCESLGTVLTKTGQSLVSYSQTGGGSWSVSTVSLPTSAANVAFTPVALSCTAPGACEAVAESDAMLNEVVTSVVSSGGGSVTTTSYGLGPILLLTETAGTWTAALAPSPASGVDRTKYATVGGLSCISGACTIVATYGKKSKAVVLAGSGTHFSPAPLPIPTGGSYPGFYGLTCTAPGDCVAVGSYQNGNGGPFGLIDTESGGTWSSLAAPTPEANYESDLNGVTCSDTGGCTAVGDFEGAFSSSALPEVLQETGGTWTAAKGKLPSSVSAKNSLSTLQSLTCTDASDCLAIGYSLSITASGNSLITSEVGWLSQETSGVWSSQVMPLPTGTAAGSSGFASAASCTSPGDCAVVGTIFSPTGEQALVDQETSGTWTASSVGVPEPLLQGTGTSRLIGHRLPALIARRAAAVERAAVHPAAPHRALALHSASQWAAGTPEGFGIQRGGLSGALVRLGTSTPALLLSGLGYVDCPAAASCSATGYYIDSNGNIHGLTSELTGSATVTGTTPPTPAGTGLKDHALEVVGEDCVAASDCTIAANEVSETSGVIVRPALVVLGTDGWVTHALPTAAGPVTNLTCSLRRCTVVGNRAKGPYVAVGHGASWRVSALPLLATQAATTVTDVTCAYANCLAIGESQVGSTLLGTLWWEHDGRWRVHAAPQQAGAKRPGELVAYAACSKASCVASGETTTFQPYLAIGTGSSWIAPKISAPGGKAVVLGDAGPVSCTPSECEALAQLLTRTGAPYVIADVQGKAVKTFAVPAPSNGLKNSAVPFDISCTSSLCVAAGFYRDRHHHLQPDATVALGGTLTAVETPVPAGSKGFSPGPLTNISCDRSGACGGFGAGRAYNGGGSYLLTGTVVKDASAWEAAAEPLPGNAAGITESQLETISCPAAPHCVAAGVYGTKAGLSEAFAAVEH